MASNYSKNDFTIEWSGIKEIPELRQSSCSGRQRNRLCICDLFWLGIVNSFDNYF